MSSVEDAVCHLDEGNPSQCPHCRSCQPGCMNYQNNIIIPIIKRILNKGAEAWYIVVLTYKEESSEEDLHSKEDLCNKWVRNCVTIPKKPTGETGEIADQIHHCIEIMRCIQHKQSWAFSEYCQEMMMIILMMSLTLPGVSPTALTHRILVE
jgi:hypothetical protein